MRKRARFGLAAVGALAALVFAGQAFAAYAPKLGVNTGPSGTTISYTQPAADDPTAALLFFVPTGITANLTAPPGASIGTVSAKASAADLGGAVLPLTGTVQVRAADGTYLSSGAQVPLATAATRCTGSAAHSAFWVLVLTAAGQSLEVPLFVDQVPVGNPSGAFASYILTVCLPAPDITGPARAAFGAKLIDATFTVRGVFSAPTAEARWRERATPYTPGAGTANTAGTIETQSLDRGPGAVTLAAKRASVTVAVSGAVTQGGKAVVGAAVQIKARGKVLGTFKTDASGKYKGTVKLAKKGALSATATVATRDLGAASCTQTFAPVPCIGATAGGFTATGKSVTA